MPQITRKNIKHLYLRIDTTGKLCVSAPHCMSNAQIFSFIEQKREWITQKQQHAKFKKEANQHHLSLLGKKIPIQRQQSKHNFLSIKDGICLMSLRDNQASTEQQLIVKHYRKTLLPLVQHYVAHYAPIIGASPNEIRTKNMKTKWGTCNTRKKRLWFNVQLSRFSPPHTAYVVVHEMVHLLEPSHNRRFYHLVQQAMPNWKIYHQALKHNY